MSASCCLPKITLSLGADAMRRRLSFPRPSTEPVRFAAILLVLLIIATVILTDR
jgi:hypothetical protein